MTDQGATHTYTRRSVFICYHLCNTPNRSLLWCEGHNFWLTCFFPISSFIIEKVNFKIENGWNWIFISVSLPMFPTPPWRHPCGTASYRHCAGILDSCRRGDGLVGTALMPLQRVALSVVLTQPCWLPSHKLSFLLQNWFTLDDLYLGHLCFCKGLKTTANENSRMHPKTNLFVASDLG